MQLAQVNIAHSLHPLDHPAMRDFVEALDYINELAEAQPGFIWRYKGSESDEESPWPEHVLPNMSVWSGRDALMHYIYRTDHMQYLRRKAEWFEKAPGPHLALWWVPDGHRPTLAEAKAKLDLIASQGPSPEAFSIAKPFEPLAPLC